MASDSSMENGTSNKACNELCGVCQIIVDTIRFEDEYQNLIHQRSFDGLSHSAKSACGICTVLLEHVQREYSYGDALDPEAELWTKLFPIRCASDTSCAAWQDSIELTLTSDGVDNLALTFTLEAIQDAGGECSNYLPSPTTNSESSHNLITWWLQQCVQGHERCNAQRREPWYPTRILDIGTTKGDEIRLVLGKSLKTQPYATLSHCWGGQHVPKTLRSNIEEHYKKIPAETLTTTFKDAIQIAYSLGLRYLWIDSLCIVQQDAQDWMVEAATMGKVYQCGFINIAATGALDGSEGCHWERNAQAILSTVVPIVWSSSESNQGRRYQVVPDAAFWARKLIDEPLNRRGWVLQERILSPRMIHFGRAQLFWECREIVACETYFNGLPSSLRQNTLVDIKTLDLGEEPQDTRWPASYISRSLASPFSLVQRFLSTILQYVQPITIREATLYGEMENAHVYRDWNTVVELYSHGILTVQQDKLVALSGIASVIKFDNRPDFRDGYLAGLWQSSLPLHLLWKTEPTPTSKDNNSNLSIPTQPEAYIAPSWSWASLKSQISFAWCRHNYNAGDYLATMTGARVTWMHEDLRFGAVKSGELSLSAPVARALWTGVRGSPTGAAALMSGYVTHIFPVDRDRKRAVRMLPDSATEAEILFDVALEDPPNEVVLLPIIGARENVANECDVTLGLVLQQDDTSDNYMRLGVFQTTRSRLCRVFRKLPRGTITIV